MIHNDLWITLNLYNTIFLHNSLNTFLIRHFLNNFNFQFSFMIYRSCRSFNLPEGEINCKIPLDNYQRSELTKYPEIDRANNSDNTLQYIMVLLDLSLIGVSR